MWHHVRIDSKHVRGSILPCLFRNRNLIHKFTCSSETQDRLTIPMNRLIKEFSNLTYLDFSNSRLLRELNILSYLPNIQHLNVSNCQSMSTYSLIQDLKHLNNLQIFICNDNYVCISAYSVYDAVNGLGTLRYIFCEQSGNMQPWIVRRVLEQNQNLLTFLFTTYFALATDKSIMNGMKFTTSPTPR